MRAQLQEIVKPELVVYHAGGCGQSCSVPSDEAAKRLARGLGIALCVVGFVLARSTPYRETTVIVRAAGCPLVTDVIDRGDDEVRGYVCAAAWLSANKKIMAYLRALCESKSARVRAGLAGARAHAGAILVRTGGDLRGSFVCAN